MAQHGATKVGINGSAFPSFSASSACMNALSSFCQNQVQSQAGLLLEANDVKVSANSDNQMTNGGLADSRPNSGSGSGSASAGSGTAARKRKRPPNEAVAKRNSRCELLTLVNCSQALLNNDSSNRVQLSTFVTERLARIAQLGQLNSTASVPLPLPLPIASDNSSLDSLGLSAHDSQAQPQSLNVCPCPSQLEHPDAAPPSASPALAVGRHSSASRACPSGEQSQLSPRADDAAESGSNTNTNRSESEYASNSNANVTQALLLSSGSAPRMSSSSTTQSTSAEQSALANGNLSVIATASAANASTAAAGATATLPLSFSPTSVPCFVCGCASSGFHCETYVCEACKKFFVRSSKNDVYKRYVCVNATNRGDGDSGVVPCNVEGSARTKCQYCRFEKCRTVGMRLPNDKTRTNAVESTASVKDIPCLVCGAESSGYHFGIITCEGCKGFFRRSICERDSNLYRCMKGGNCPINTETRNMCRHCRYQKCLKVGMAPWGSRIGRQPNAVKHATRLHASAMKAARADQSGAKGHNDSTVSDEAAMRIGDRDEDMDGDAEPGDYNDLDDDESNVDIDTEADERQSMPPHSHEVVSAESHRGQAEPLIQLQSHLARRGNTQLAASNIATAATAWSAASAGTMPNGDNTYIRAPFLPSNQAVYSTNGAENVAPTALNAFRPAFGGSLFGQFDAAANSASSNAFPFGLHTASPFHLFQSQPSASSLVGAAINTVDPQSFTTPYLNQMMLGLSTSQPALAAFAALYREMHTNGQTNNQSVLSDHAAGLQQLSGAVPNSPTPNTTASTSRATVPGEHRPLENDGNTRDSRDNFRKLRLLTEAAARLVNDPVHPSVLGNEPADDMEGSTYSNGLTATDGVASPPLQSRSGNTPYVQSEAEMEAFRCALVTGYREELRRFNDRRAYNMETSMRDGQTYIQSLWEAMMSHFEMHTRQLCRFVKSIPGFNTLCDADKPVLMKNGMYMIVLVLLSRDFDVSNEKGYNYFGFTPSDRERIIKTFPGYWRIARHCKLTGRFIKQLALDDTEYALLCCFLYVSYDASSDEILEGPEQCKSILIRCVEAFEDYSRRKYNSAFRYTEILLRIGQLNRCNDEHVRILCRLKKIWSFLEFRPLYTEMFSLPRTAETQPPQMVAIADQRVNVPRASDEDDDGDDDDDDDILAGPLDG